jgi:hypothetical protein
MNDRRKLNQDFLQAFPLEHLPEMTLEQYTDLKRDNSFCYWVESRTDTLGSIWGGSSFKFGIYEYQNVPSEDNNTVTHDDKYAWYRKYQKPSAAEAFEVVHDTIIKIANLARSGQFEEIDKIQNVFGDVYKWKIAFLYSNEKLLAFYQEDMLRLLAKHYNMPNADRASRLEIHRFLLPLKGDKDFWAFHDELLSVVRADEAQHHVWIYSPGRNAQIWDECFEQHVMRLGWDELGDLAKFKNRSEINEALRKTYNNPNNSYKNDCLALWTFVHKMRPGDIVFAKKGRDTIIGRGIVRGDYEFDEDASFKNVRAVEWTHKGEWSHPGDAITKTLTDITEYPGYVKKLEDIVNGRAIPSGDIRYWWLVANPKIWSMIDMAVGTKVEYSLYNDNDKPRRIAQNFLDAKVGDKVIGYESTPTKQIVAMLEVSRANDGKTIEYTKTKSLERPVDYSSFKDLPELASMQFLQNPQGSFFALTQAEYEAVIEMIDDDNPIRTTSKEEPEIYDKEDFLSEVYMKEEDYDSLLYLLKTKKNIILQGAPGVGKTFSAKRLAYSMMGMKDEERVEVVQFHQNYTYEDFIMGYKPTEDGGFKLMNGIFYRFCKKAESDPEREYFFIIDEINRGNLSKVFGELMMLIENGYRGKSIKLAYTNESFSVPENIYLIGMMNTADRSLAMIDYALRRRFSFFDMKPGFDSEGFKEYQKDLNNETFDRFIQAIESLNDTIAKDDSLGTGFCIGHSYFCEQKSFDKQWLENVLNYDIAPMLREYWFDNATKANTQIEELRKILK